MAKKKQKKNLQLNTKTRGEKLLITASVKSDIIKSFVICCGRSKGCFFFATKNFVQ